MQAHVYLAREDEWVAMDSWTRAIHGWLTKNRQRRANNLCVRMVHVTKVWGKEKKMHSPMAGRGQWVAGREMGQQVAGREIGWTSGWRAMDCWLEIDKEKRIIIHAGTWLPSERGRMGGNGQLDKSNTRLAN